MSSADARLALQTLALTGLGHWLDVAPPSHHNSEEGIIDIASALTRKTDIGHVKAAALRRFDAGFLVTGPPEWTLKQTQWIVWDFGPIRLRGLIARLRDFRVPWRRKTSAPLAPIASQVLDAIAQDAWTSPEFAISVARILRSYARVRVILYPDTDACPALTGPSLWAAAAEGARHIRIPSQAGCPTHFHERLDAKAASAMQADSWAGFWDAFILARARAADTAVKIPDLPLGFGLETNDISHFRPKWQVDAPGYAIHLIANAL
jgi:hypothetical protein